MALFPYSFGYLPDLPDPRDYTIEHPKISPLLSPRGLGPLSPRPPKPPTSVDLRAFCPPVFDQGSMGSCTANAAAGMLEYHNKRVYGKETPLSRMFIYKCTRDLMQAKGDSGAYIRATMGSLALFGTPPEKYWAYPKGQTATPDPLEGSTPTGAPGIDDVPPAFCYSYAQNYQALSYFRLDEKSAGIPSKAKDSALLGIRRALFASLPVMFGFTVYESISRAGSDGKIPYPKRNEPVLGGHAVLAVGYDDALTIDDKVGAFLIRNSWGESWGARGYGWLPYEYLLAGLAQDWWCLVKAEWVDTEQFGV